MKRSIIILFVLALSNLVLAQNTEAEKEAIKKVIVDSYIDGLFNNGDAVALKKGVHYDCDILVFENGNMRRVPAYAYVERLEKKPGPVYPGTSCEFTDIHVTGFAAMTIVEIYRDNGWHNYTDYLSLYKFDDGWKVVSRVSYLYPKN